MSVLAQKRLFTVDEYYKMAQSHILAPTEHVELIEGEIFQKTPVSSNHAGTVAYHSELFIYNLKDKVIVWAQSPIRLSQYSEPEPDIALLKPRSDFYKNSHPAPEDVWLIIETEDSSIAYDRQIKMPLYARHGIPEFWIVDLNQKAIEAYSQPSPEGYSLLRTVRPSQSLSPFHFPELDLPVRNLFE
ncbi:MAG: Uma2 family endonuclease [Candidatus Omnitrophota bacterium]